MGREMAVLIGLGFIAACATSGSTMQAGGTGSASSAGAVVMDSTHLMSDEFAAAGLPTAYDIVQRFRRPWLRRDALTGGDVTVYVEEQSLGGAQALRDIPAVQVESFEFLPNEKATLRWGSSIKGSVIVVKRKY